MPTLPSTGIAMLLAFAAAGAGTAPVLAQVAPSQAAVPDVHFISGMIVHHAQAVLMARWAPTHGASPALRELCERITISQRDEIATMERWLNERHLPLPDTSTAGGAAMAGMAGMGGGGMMMPGMLSPAQLAQLDSARGPAFDRAFLTFMIQHHQGALTMVAQYMNAPSADEDPFVFQFASDVNGDQTAEIDRMGRMLAAMPPAPRSQ